MATYRVATMVMVAALAAACRPAALPGGDGTGGAGGGTASASAGTPPSGAPPSAVVGAPDLASPPGDAAAACASFTCDIAGTTQTETCSAADYCYRGAESPSAYYVGDGSVQYGCNALPAECAATPTCACVLRYYRAGFCTCDDRCGLSLFCSLA